jgi:glycerol-3-phosphate acyltransferase PlsY
MSLQLIISTLISYFVGGIPVGFIIGKLKGIDVRKIGTFNISATNVFHTVGRFSGIITGTLDMLKPIVTMAVFSHLNSVPDYTIPFLGASTVCGNLWSPFLKWRGGRGLSSSIGYFLYVMPRVVPFIFITFFLAMFFTKWNMPVGGLSLYIVDPIIAEKIYHYPHFIIMATFYLGLFVLLRQIPWIVIHLIRYYRRKQYGEG